MSNNTLRTEAVAKAVARNKSSALSAMSSAFDRLLLSDELTEDRPPPPAPPHVVPPAADTVAEKRELSPNSKRKLIEAKMQAWAGSVAVATTTASPPPEVMRRTSQGVVETPSLDEKRARRVSVPAIKNFELVSQK